MTCSQWEEIKADNTSSCTTTNMDDQAENRQTGLLKILLRVKQYHIKQRSFFLTKTTKSD